MDDINFAINRFILININGSKSQKSWELIIRTYSVQASCGREGGRKDMDQDRILDSSVAVSLCICKCICFPSKSFLETFGD